MSIRNIIHVLTFLYQHILILEVNLMQKSALWISLFFVLILSGCGTNDEDHILAELEKYDVQSVKVEVTAGDFIYRLFTEKEEYSSSEDVKMYAELEYIGEKMKSRFSMRHRPFIFRLRKKYEKYKFLIQCLNRY